MSRESYKTEEYRGYTINIYYDEDAQSPREWDNLGTIYSNSRSYDPDNHSIEEILNDEHTGMSQEFKENYIWLKIRGYQHSGLTISVSGGYPYNDPWDSGLFGVIAVSKEKAIKEFGKKICTKKVREKALNCLRGEVETLDMYYTGDVYGFVIEDENGDEVDSCWGYFGSEYIDKDLIPECKSIIDSMIEKRQKTHDERIEKVKANVTLLIGNTFIFGSDCYRVGVDKLFGLPLLEKATQRNGRIREEYYTDVQLSDIPEDVLADMAKLVA